MPFKKAESEPEKDEPIEIETLKEPEPEINEVKHETFLRIAKPRVQKILNSLRILGNCSNKSTYAYTFEEVEKIFDTIGIALSETKEKFLAQPVAKSKLFEF